MNMFYQRYFYPVVLSVLLSALLSGCANQGYSVIASTSTTIGVGISQQPTNGTFDATFGYKRAEIAFVPTNRNSGEIAGDTGGGAKDTGNVIMELRYLGIFSTDADSGIYQRLAVGDIAVKENGTALLFAKGPDGKVNPETASAILAVQSVPVAAPEATADKTPLSRKYKSYKDTNDSASVKKFNDAAVEAGFKDFDSFLIEPNTTPQKVKTVRDSLETNGISFDK